MANKEVDVLPVPKGMKLNPDQAHVNKIVNKLGMTGGYCPCLPNRTEDTICPCKYARKQSVCRCGLYVRKSE